MEAIVDQHEIDIRPEANSLLEQNQTIKEAAFDIVMKCVDVNREKFDQIQNQHPNLESCKQLFIKAKNHHKNKNNIYIFNFADLKALVEKTNATHIMVIEGAQQFAKYQFEIGQSTIIIAPCIDSGDTNDQGKKYKTVGTKAKEHPQFRFERVIPFNKESAEIEVYKQD